MLEEMMAGVMGKTISQEYPHLKLPAVVLATVSGAKKLSDTYEVKELEVTDEDSGRTFKAHYKAFYYEYRLNVLDRFGERDDTFPTLPGVRSRLQLEPGTVVAVALVYGNLSPAIIGEVSA